MYTRTKHASINVLVCEDDCATRPFTLVLWSIRNFDVLLHSSSFGLDPRSDMFSFSSSSSPDVNHHKWPWNSCVDKSDSLTMFVNRQSSLTSNRKSTHHEFVPSKVPHDFVFTRWMGTWEPHLSLWSNRLYADALLAYIGKIYGQQANVYHYFNRLWNDSLYNSIDELDFLHILIQTLAKIPGRRRVLCIKFGLSRNVFFLLTRCEVLVGQTSSDISNREPLQRNQIHHWCQRQCAISSLVEIAPERTDRSACHWRLFRLRLWQWFDHHSHRTVLEIESWTNIRWWCLRQSEQWIHLRQHRPEPIEDQSR